MRHSLFTAEGEEDAEEGRVSNPPLLVLRVLCGEFRTILVPTGIPRPGPFLLTFTGHCPYNDPRAPSDAALRAGKEGQTSDESRGRHTG